MELYPNKIVSLLLTSIFLISLTLSAQEGEETFDPWFTSVTAGDAQAITEANSELVEKIKQQQELLSQLIDYLGNPSAKVRKNAAICLGKVADEQHTQRLEKFLAEEQDPQVRRELALAILKTGDLSSSSLVEYLYQAKDPQIRLLALKQFLPEVERDNLKPLVNLLLDKSLQVRQQAFQKLTEIAGVTLGYHPEASLLERIAATAKWQEWHKVNSLFLQLASSQPEEASYAISQLVEMGTSVISHLSREYPQASLEVKKRVCQVFARIPNQDAIALLTEALSAEEMELRKAARQALVSVAMNNENLGAKEKLKEFYETSSGVEKFLTSLDLLLLEDETGKDFVKQWLEKEDTEWVSQLQPRHAQALLPLLQDKKQLSSPLVQHFLQGKTTASHQILIHHYQDLTNEQKLEMLALIQQTKDKESLRLLAPYLATAEQEILLETCRLSVELQVNLLEGSENITKLTELYPELSLEQKAVVLDTLKQSNQEQAIAFVAQVAKTSEEPALKEQALAIFLEKKPDAEKIKFLFELIRKETEQAAKLLLLQKVNKYISGGQFDLLAEFVRTTENHAVKVAATRIAARMSQASDLMYELIQKAPSQEVVKIAVDTLSRSKPENAYSKLAKLYQESAATYQATILAGLIKLDRDKGLELLKKEIAKEKSSVELFALLARNDSQAAAENLVRFMKERSAEEKLQVLRASGNFVTLEHLPVLMQLLDSSNQELVKEAQQALFQLTRQDYQSAEKWQDWYQTYQKVQEQAEELIAAPLAEIPKVQEQLAQNKKVAMPVLASLFRKESTTLEQKKNILWTIAPWNTIATQRFLESLIHHPHKEIRARAYRFLEEFGNDIFHQQLPLLYAKEMEPLAKVNLLYALLYEDQSYEEDILHFTDEESLEVWLTITDILREGLVSTDKYLLKVLEQAPSQDIRMQVLTPLAVQKDVYTLVKTLRKSTTSQVTKALLDTLAKIATINKKACSSKEQFLEWWEKEGDKENLSTILRSELDKFLTGNLLQSSQAKERLLRSEKTYQVVVDFLQERRVTHQEKEEALALLSTFASKENASFFEDYLDDPNPRLRRIAAQTLSKIGYDKIPELIKHAFRDEDHQIRFYMTRALGENADDEALALLEQATDDKDARVREEALYWLNIHDASKEETIRERLQDRAPGVLVLAIEAAGEKKMRQEGDKLISYLNNPFRVVRKAAYEALLSISGQNIAFDPNVEDRTERVTALKEWQTWWQATELERKLNEYVDTFAQEGVNAEKVRERIAQHRVLALVVLKDRLDDPRGFVRLQVVKSIAQIGERASSLVLAKKLLDPDIRVRQAALEALEKVSGKEIELALDEAFTTGWQQKVAEIQTWWQEQLQKKQEAGSQVTADVKEQVSKLVQAVVTQEKELAQAKESLLELPQTALGELAKQVQAEDNQNALAAGKLLAKVQGQEAIPTLLPLLQRSEIQEPAKTLLEKLMDREIVLEKVGEEELDFFLSELRDWWRIRQVNLYEQMEEKIAEILSKAEEKGREQTSKKLAELGNSARILLEENLATDQVIQRESCISALVQLNDPRAIPSLVNYLTEGEAATREYLLQGINALAGRIFQEQMPQDDEQWQALADKISTWWQESTDEREQNLTSALEQAKQELTDPQTREATAEKLAQTHPNIDTVATLWLEKEESTLQLAGLSIIRKVGDINNVASILSLVTAKEEKVREAAYQALQQLAQTEEIPERPTQSKLIAEQVQTLQSEWQKKLQKEIDTEALRQVLIQLASAQTEEQQQQAQDKLQKFGTSALKHIAIFTNAKDDRVRQGVLLTVRALGDHEQGELVVSLLPDPNIHVREKAYQVLEHLAGTSLPVAWIEEQEQSWQKTVSDRQEKWQESEKQYQVEQELTRLEKAADKLENLEQLWTPQQVAAARSVVTFLRSPHQQVETQAATILERVSRGQEIIYEVTAAPERKQEMVKEYQVWLDREQERIKEYETELKEREEEFAEMKAQAKGDIYTLDEYEEVMDYLNEMEEARNPLVLQQYVAVLKGYGLEVAELEKHLYQESEREDQLYELKAKLYDRREEIAKRQSTYQEKIKELTPAFQLMDVASREDLKLAQQLVTALESEYYPLRQTALESLTNLTGSDKGFVPETAPSEQPEALEEWQNWLSEAEQELAQEEQLYTEEIAAKAEELKSQQAIVNEDALENAKELVQALSFFKEDVRKQALQALETLAQTTFDFDPSKAPEEQSEALEKWQQWVDDKEKQLQQMAEIRETARFIKNAPEITEASEVEKMQQLIDALTHPKPEFRQLAIEALAAYVKEHSADEVREEFGYDAQATPELIEQKAKEWQKWFAEHIRPIAKQQKQRLAQVNEAGAKLTAESWETPKGWAQAQFLVGHLEDPSVTVRQAALSHLQEVSNNAYGLEVEADPETQELALKSWQWWLEQQKQKLIQEFRQKYLLEEDGEKLVTAMISALANPISEIRQLAASWLSDKSGQKFTAAASKEKQQSMMARARAWQQEHRITQAKKLAEEGWSDKLLSALEQLKKNFEAQEEKIVQQTAQTFNQIADHEFGYTKEKHAEVKKEITQWINTHQKFLKTAQELQGKKVEEFTSEDLAKVDMLSDALFNEYLSVRRFAIKQLNEISGEEFEYDAQASTEEREKGYNQVQDWLDKLKK